MLTPGTALLSPVAGAQSEDAVAAASATEALDAIAAWLAGGSVGDVPRTATGLLDDLRGGLPLPEGVQAHAWDAYFAALGTRPTAQERAAIRDFQARHPHVAAEVESLALAVARAQRLRDDAFSTLTDAQWALLPEATSRLAGGQPLSPGQRAAVDAIDLGGLIDAAAILARAGEDAPARLQRAQELDAALDASIPFALRDPAAYDDPAALVRAAADAAPVRTDLSLEDALLGIEVLSGTPLEGLNGARLLPEDLHAPLAAILVAHSRELSAERAGAGRATLATLADQLPALTRAAYNLSIASPGAQAAPLGRARPLHDLSTSGFTQPLRVIQDLFGEGVQADAPDATFVAGFERLSAALGKPPTAAQLEQARATEAALGEPFATALGRVMAAQAAYEAAQPDADLLALRAKATEAVSTDGPLTLDRIDALQESATAERAFRDRLGVASFSLARAILAVPRAQPQPMAAGTSEDEILFDQNGVLILKDGPGTLEAWQFGGPRILLVDLGGDETYRIPVATIDGPGGVSTSPGPNEARSSVLIDLGGNDRYEAPGDHGPAATVGSPTSPAFTMLLDVSGDDTYLGRSGAGYAQDGLAFLVDARGEDVYQFSGRAIAHARGTLAYAATAGVLVDGIGNDRYVVPGGIAVLADDSISYATIAALVDVTGNDRYEPVCPKDPRVACIGVPRARNESSDARGAAVFIDAYGTNTYPRNATDPILTGNEASDETGDDFNDATSVEPFCTPGEDEGCAALTCDETTSECYELPLPESAPERFVFVYDGARTVRQQEGTYCAITCGFVPDQFPTPGGAVEDRDGDIVPDAVEIVLGTDPQDSASPFAPDGDTDGDGFPDLVEALLGTSRNDSGSYPAGIPRTPDPVPDVGILPSAPENFVVNLPGILAIGGPGPTRYKDPYTLVVDLGLGLGDVDGDVYLDLVGVNGHALDLGGDDDYKPVQKGDAPVSSMAVVDTRSVGRTLALNSSYRFYHETASLIDLAGRDEYVAQRDSLGHARGKSGSVALFLDAGGADVYRAPQGRSQGFAQDGASAFFLDLRGNDKHFAPTQALTSREGGARYLGLVSIDGDNAVNDNITHRWARGVLFVDGGGSDVYDAGASPILPDRRDHYQGRVIGSLLPGGGSEAPAAVFMDLGDHDRYYIVDAANLTQIEISAEKEDRLRVEPVDGSDPNTRFVQAFLDTTAFGESGIPDEGQSPGADSVVPRDGDDDGGGTGAGYDIAETAAGTDPRDPESTPVGGASGKTLLHLPRAGLVVGANAVNTYRAGVEYALQVDLGGADTYLHRVGASSPRFPVSLAIDQNGDDDYRHDGAVRIDAFLVPKHDNTVESPTGTNFGDLPAPDVYGVAQGAGLFGVGVLVDGAGRDEFLLTARAPAECETCPAAGHGLGQGAGLLGVGVLILGGDQGDAFHADVSATAGVGSAKAFTLAQGAAILGVGVLASTGIGYDEYELRASAASDTSVLQGTSGQGYAFWNGTGILLDGGGDNHFVATNLAQGVGGAEPTMRAPPFNVPSTSVIYPVSGVGFTTGHNTDWRNFRYDPQRTLGALLLPGVGRDTLESSYASQAFAGGDSARGLVFDAEGDDTRTLTPPEGTLLGLGQGAAIYGGHALLLDNRGNDRYEAPATAVQGFAFGAVGLLVDLAGSDTYESLGDSQAFVGDLTMERPLTIQLENPGTVTGVVDAQPIDQKTMLRSSHPAVALLLDRMGNDAYTVPEGARAQGFGAFDRELMALRTNVPGVTSPRGFDVDRHVGFAFFVDAGGLDGYTGVPDGQVPLHTVEQSPYRKPRPDDGNNWGWEASEVRTGDPATGADQASTQSPFIGYGIDDSTTEGAFRALTGGVVKPQSMEVKSGCTAGVCSGDLTLSAALSGVPSNGIDRVEFFDESIFIDLGKPSGSAYGATFQSAEVEDGLPKHEDGTRQLSALIYLRAGTPDASGRRVAVDAEPFQATTLVKLDNAPLMHRPELGSPSATKHGAGVAVSKAYGPVDVSLRVDRDLDRCDPTCPAFSIDHLQAAADEWGHQTMNLGVTPVADAKCTSSGCKAASVTAEAGGGKAYLTWTAPSLVKPIGYVIDREAASGALTFAGYVDARAAPKAFSPGDTAVYWFVDTNPGAATKYHVKAVHLDASGAALFTDAVKALDLNTGAPGPTRGLRALGVENAVHLVWRAADGATKYKITREDRSGNVEDVATVNAPATSYPDAGGVKDRPYTYRVTAYNGNTATQVPSLPAAGRASPGHTVDVALQASLDPASALAPRLLDAASFGGAQTHAFSWDLAAVPDGLYFLNTTITDGAARDEPRWNATPIVLDGTPPKTTIGLPGSVGGPYLTTAGLRIPFSVAETGAGVNRTAFFVKVDNEPWPTTPIFAAAGAKDFIYTGTEDGATLSILAVSIDKVGNVEGVETGAREWAPTLMDGFAGQLAKGTKGGYSLHVLDLTPPSAKGSSRTFVVRPGERVEFAINVTDEGTGVDRVTANIRGETVPLSAVAPGRFAGEWKATAPDGIIQILIEVLDRAGNEATVSAGAVIVDATPPTLVETTVAFPGGRVVGRPGETANLVVRAEDLYVNEGGLNVSAETGNVSSAGKTYLRYDADGRFYVASFPVNRLVGKQANVTIRALDAAGNLAERNLLVHVNNSATALSVPTLVVGPDRVLVNFTTPDEARGRVDFGLSPQMGEATSVGSVGRNHSLLVTGLKPDTDYYAFAVALTDAGIETRSDLLVFRTGASFNVTLTPGPGTPFSRGEASVGVGLLRHDAVAPLADLEAYLLAPRGSPRLVAAGNAVGAASALDLDLASVRDGDYALVVKAREGDLKGESAPMRLVLDRAAPLLSPPEALAASKGATMTLHVEERGSGIDLANVTWTFGPRRCSAVLSGDTLACVVPDLGADGDVDMAISIPDRAGNVARLELRLPVDAAAPVVADHRLGAADGSLHLRAGARGRVSVDVQDLGVKGVEADLSRFGGSKATALDRIPGTTRYEAVFDVPEDFPEGPVTLLVRATDTAGHLTAIAVTSRVDATAPTMLRGSLVPQAPGEVMIALQLDEPVLVRAKAAGPLGDVKAESAEFAATQVLSMKGLRPGAALRAAVTLVDQAGIETTLLLDGRALADATPPTKVPRLAVEDRGDGRVLLRWEKAEDDDAVAHYRVIRALAGAAPVTLPTVTGLLATDDVPTGVEATYTVAAVDASGNAGEVATAKVTSVAVPRLANGTVEPPVGGPGLYTFRVVVTDASGQVPQVVVRVDGVAHPMTADKADCREGCVYTAVVLVGAETLAGGPHEHAFEVVSGPFRVAFPEIDTLQGPTVLQGEPPALSGVLAAANRVPGGGILFAALAIVVALVAAVLLRRRKA